MFCGVGGGEGGGKRVALKSSGTSDKVQKRFRFVSFNATMQGPVGCDFRHTINMSHIPSWIPAVGSYGRRN